MRSRSERISKNFFLFLSGIILGLWCAISYAYVFVIVPKAGTAQPTIISPGSQLPAYYTISNNTREQRNNNFIKYLPPNVQQVTAGGVFADTCGPTFNLTPAGQPGSSCTLQLLITGPVNGSDPDPHHHLFACFPGGLSCAGTNFGLDVNAAPLALASINITPLFSSINRAQTQQYTAIGTYTDTSTRNITTSVNWLSSNTHTATISSTGLATAINSGTTNITAQQGAITSNAATLSVIRYAFVVNRFTDSVSSCPVNLDGSFGACTTVAGGFTDPVSIAVNPTGTIAYISGLIAAGPVKYCVINNDGTFGACNNANGTTVLGGVAVNPAGTLVYYSQLFTNQVFYCTLNPNGSFNVCTDTGATSLNGPFGIDINSAGTIAYIANNGNQLNCTIDLAGTLSACNVNSTGISAASLTINSADTFAYIPVFSGTGGIDICPINPDQSLGTCGPAGGGTFNFPTNVAFNFENTFAYIGSGNTDQFVHYCPVNPDGSFGTCLPANTAPSLFSAPYSLALV